MNIIEELGNVDFNDPGRWPTWLRASAVILVFLLVSIGGIWRVVIASQLPQLESQQQIEQSKRQEFERKQKKAANFNAYKEQLASMQSSFGAMLRQLPGRTEVPNLLIDISQAGLGAGLEENLFQPGTELQKEFYAELPIKMRLAGTFHQFGNFVSDVSALPRIVTLHDISIAPRKDREGNSAGLVLDLTAKTYRYIENEGGAAP